MYLLLGVGFEQTVLDSRPGPLLPQVEAVTGIPCADILHWVQKGLFEDVAVQGRAVHRAIGIRDRRLAAPGEPCMVFIDARTLGKPLCCRAVPHGRASIQQLLQLIDVDLPATLQPEIVGGNLVSGQPTL